MTCQVDINVFNDGISNRDLIFDKCIGGVTLTVHFQRIVFDYECPATPKTYAATDTFKFISQGNKETTLSYTINATQRNLSGSIVYNEISGNFNVIDGTKFSLSSDNSNLIGAFGTLGGCTAGSNITFLVTREALSIPQTPQQSCGPVIIGYVTDSEDIIMISVTDKGYSYVKKGNKLYSFASQSYEKVTSMFNLYIPPTVKEDNLLKYVLSGFVLGTFCVKCKFDTKLLLSPFRNFYPLCN